MPGAYHHALRHFQEKVIAQRLHCWIYVAEDTIRDQSTAMSENQVQLYLRSNSLAPPDLGPIIEADAWRQGGGAFIMYPS